MSDWPEVWTLASTLPVLGSMSSKVSGEEVPTLWLPIQLKGPVVRAGYLGEDDAILIWMSLRSRVKAVRIAWAAQFIWCE